MKTGKPLTYPPPGDLKKGPAQKASARWTAEPVAFMFPLYGSKAVEPMTQEQLEKEQREMEAQIRTHWDHPGVKSLVQLLEREAAIAQQRACVPMGHGPAGNDRDHQAGQGFALNQFLARLQRVRWPGANRA